jgi:translation initiation factor 3 subunit D
MKIGYVSRKHPCASQITLSMNMCWGIFKKFVDRFQNLPEGKYLILRDPNKPVVRLYSVPPGTFEEDDEYDEE